MQTDSWQPTPEEVDARREKNEPTVAWWRGHVAQPWSPARLWTERGEVYGDFYGTRVLARSMGGLWGGWAFTPDEIGYIQGALDVERDRASKAEREFEEADAEAGRRLGETRRERDEATQSASFWGRAAAKAAAERDTAVTAALRIARGLRDLATKRDDPGGNDLDFAAGWIEQDFAPRARAQAAEAMSALRDWIVTLDAMHAENGILTAKGEAHARANQRLAEVARAWFTATQSTT